MEKFKNIPVTEWNKMLRAVEKLAADAERGETISEKDAANLLGLQIDSIRNRVYDGKIPSDCYTKPVTGHRVYFKNRLLGINK